LPVSEQQLQQLCSCCPAVEDLAFCLSRGSPSTAYLPLLQLSALASLKIKDVGAAAAAAAVGVAAQLTGLKQLVLQGLPQLTDPALLQLTALTALETLKLIQASGAGFSLFVERLFLDSMVRCHSCTATPSVLLAVCWFQFAFVVQMLHGQGPAGSLARAADRLELCTVTVVQCPHRQQAAALAKVLKHHVVPKTCAQCTAPICQVPCGMCLTCACV
jgi:hypothetical protein